MSPLDMPPLALLAPEGEPQALVVPIGCVELPEATVWQVAEVWSYRPSQN